MPALRNRKTGKVYNVTGATIEAINGNPLLKGLYTEEKGMKPAEVEALEKKETKDLANANPNVVGKPGTTTRK